MPGQPLKLSTHQLGVNITPTPNFYEETQIAKIYGMTEDYTPPRRIRTAFMIYSEHRREEIIEDNPGIG